MFSFLAYYFFFPVWVSGFKWVFSKVLLGSAVNAATAVA